MIFWLGTHKPHWLERTDGRLFLSHRRMRERSRLPRARGPWALDSGAFSELKKGRFETTPEEYVEAIGRYAEGCGRLEWAAPQDWMTEPEIRERTGLTVREHQERTIENVIELRALKPAVPVIPVIQGWTLDEYLACVGYYLDAGIDLRREPLVGVGSVCRRQATSEIAIILSELSAIGLRLHGFGVKALAIESASRFLISADSMAWSQQARRNPPLPECRHGKDGKSKCSNCLRYAERYRRNTERRIAGAAMPYQLVLTS